MRARTHCGYILALTVTLRLSGATAQSAPHAPSPSQKTAMAIAGPRFQCGSVKRFFLGDTYRDLWTTPITVPVLDLDRYAGGLKPTEAKKGNQTRSLRFKNSEGLEYTFRLVDKFKNTPRGWEGTGLEKSLFGGIAHDQVSAQHPAAAVVAHGFLGAAGVLHPEPKLVIMPDDPALGKFREEFAGRLGWIEPFPNVPENGPSESRVASRADVVVYTRPASGFAGALEIIDSDSLLVLLNADPHQQVDDRAYLRARLVDIFLNDWDRHSGNWKWARLKRRGKWEPIARDRDKVMVNYGGVAALAGKMVPQLVHFNDVYPSMKTMTVHSLALDRRLLSGLSASTYDSTATFLKTRFTDALIDSALRAMPVEYQYTVPQAAAIFRARRDKLSEAATDLYRYLAHDVDIHVADHADRATVTLIDRRRVDIEVRVGDAPPHFRRRFDATETREVRLYLHGGDDRVVVRGEARPDLRVRVIGGNGENTIVDSRSDTSDTKDLRTYDSGDVTGVVYGPNKIKTENADDEPNFDRRPLIDYAGRWRAAPKDAGVRFDPLIRLAAPGDLGLVPGLGIAREQYGFRSYPYSSRIEGLAEYSTGVDGWRATIDGDKRFEDDELHLQATARMSDLEVLNFYGYGNDTPDGPEDFFEVRQRQWMFHPTVAYALGTRTDIAFGPIVQYSTMDSVPDRFITETQPYGFGDFGQAGFRLGLYGDMRDSSDKPHRKVLLDISATAYPAWWDVQKPYGVLNAVTATTIRLPVPVHPVLALRAGGRKLLGNHAFPFHDAAFVGGRPSERGEPRERYAGDGSLYGTVEVRFPVAQFALLLPLDTGVYVWGDAARVYLDGDSPGGWHTSRGVGAWIGILSPATSLTLEGEPGKSGVNARIGLTF